MMEFIHPDRPTKFRIGWYNEIKIPQLQSILLMDEGQNDLASRQRELSLIINKEMKIFDAPVKEPIFTTEEKFVDLALQSKGQHAKAKLLIMELLDKISDQDKKNSRIKPGQAKD